MLRRTPPLEAIEIFVAAAQGESFRSVARQMALSPSAVSRRIASLEAFLGVPLFDRSTGMTTLNAAGERYLWQVEPAVEAVRNATAILSRSDVPRLKIATSHSFAFSWLVPRLPDIQQSEGIEVEILATRDFDALRSGEAQLGIWGGLGVPDDMTAQTLFQAEVVPVSAPVLADGRAPPTTVDDLMDHLLLSVGVPARLWERWLALSTAVNRSLAMREFATLQLKYEAAAAGLGIALAVPLVTESYLLSGRLVPCLTGPRQLGETYRLYRLGRRQRHDNFEQAFIRWLLKRVGESCEKFREISAASLLETTQPK